MSDPPPPHAEVPTTLTTIEVVHASDSLPEFLTSDPSLWFVQLEASFDGRSTLDSKKRRCISMLPQDVIPQVADLIQGDASYTDLKDRLIFLYGRSQEANIHTLLQGTRLGDEKPLATEADNIAAASAMTNTPDDTALKIAALTNQVSQTLEATTKLTADAVRNQNPGPSRRRDRSPPPPRKTYGNQPQERTTAHVQICRYHQKFEEEARNCVQPCFFYKKHSKNE